MTIEPTEKQVLDEMKATGGDDYFATAARLEQQLTTAAAAAAKLKPQPADVAPWLIEPSEAAIREVMQFHGFNYTDARAAVQIELEADARRLAAVDPEASAEIAGAVAEAQAAQDRAEELLADHQATLDSITSQILAVGNLRKKICTAQSLVLNDEDAKNLAMTALHYFVQRRLGADSPQNASGWRTFIEDLAFRSALTDHVAGYIEPLEKQVKEIISSVRTEAKASRIDLKRVFALLANERGVRGGQHLEIDSSLYEGLL
jgi:hypothetical protein